MEHRRECNGFSSSIAQKHKGGKSDTTKHQTNTQHRVKNGCRENDLEELEFNFIFSCVFFFRKNLPQYFIYYDKLRLKSTAESKNRIFFFTETAKRKRLSLSIIITWVFFSKNKMWKTKTEEEN